MDGPPPVQPSQRSPEPLKLAVVDLFCGAGGLSEGFRQAGYQIIAGTDVDPDACATYHLNFPEAEVICGDLREGTIREQLLAVAAGADVIIGEASRAGRYHHKSGLRQAKDQPANSAGAGAVTAASAQVTPPSARTARRRTLHGRRRLLLYMGPVGAGPGCECGKDRGACLRHLSGARRGEAKPSRAGAGPPVSRRTAAPGDQLGVARPRGHYLPRKAIMWSLPSVESLLLCSSRAGRHRTCGLSVCPSARRRFL
jgi:hypothetical protein